MIKIIEILTKRLKRRFPYDTIGSEFQTSFLKLVPKEKEL
jgi:hypothetical protein